MAIFTERELAYLREQRLGRLATVQKDGTVQNSPVCFGYNDELQTIDIGGYKMAATQKFHNVSSGAKVAFVVDDIVSVKLWMVRCLEIRGDAEALIEPATPAGHVTGAIIRIYPRRILSFGIDPNNMAAGMRSVVRKTSLDDLHSRR